LETLADFVRAGASAVGLGSALVEKEALERRDLQRLRDLAAAYVERMRVARAGLKK
jgi:2-dehydro-3-deoxyphosphogluconate aldolase/(4S)-4-hydroxy-2-oxoglutarate aldolase